MSSVKQTQIEDYVARPVSVTRHGYAKSGIVLYLARCRNREALREYVSKVLPLSPRFADDAIPFAFSIVHLDAAMDGVVEEARDGLVLVCHLVVVGDDEGEVNMTEENRSWNHEVGHLGYFFGTWGYPRLCSVFGYPPPGEADKSEAAAYMTEYAMECVTRDFCEGPAVSSGLPFVLPWMEDTDADS